MKISKTGMFEIFPIESEGEIIQIDSVYSSPSDNGFLLVNLSKPINVYCDLNDNLLGWTIVMKRKVDRTKFWQKSWKEYKEGFGDVNDNYWIGLENLHRLAKNFGAGFLEYKLNTKAGRTITKVFQNILLFGEDSDYKIQWIEYTEKYPYYGDSNYVLQKRYFSHFNRTSVNTVCRPTDSGWWFSKNDCHENLAAVHPEYKTAEDIEYIQVKFRSEI